ncbi:MAG: NAD(P)-dependent oxidoreductase [Lachnospiraceae bacterium]|nr:NAD(P)-dependent oxidoreductase [Lachnospiraceae bacterium]
MKQLLEIPAYRQELSEIAPEFASFTELDGKHFLITGAGGLIGRYLTDLLMTLKEKYFPALAVTVLARNREKTEAIFAPYLADPGFKVLIRDVTLLTAEDTVESYDYLIHAASNAHPLAYAKDPVGTFLANITGTERMVGLTLRNAHARFLFLSSSEVYGPADNDVDHPLYEDDYASPDIRDPRSCYSESKRAAETYCACCRVQYGLDYVAVRPGHVYGPTATDSNSRADIQFFRKAVAGEEIVMKSEGKQCRSYCYIGDAARGLLYALLKGESGAAYNISNRHSYVTIRGLAEKIAEKGGTTLRFELPDQTEKAGFSRIQMSILAPDKLEALGFAPIFSLDKGVERTARLMKAMQE